MAGRTKALLAVLAVSVTALAAAYGADDAGLLGEAATGGLPALACTHVVAPTTNLEAAINARGPGDTLCLRGGTYEEADDRVNLSTNAAGVAGKPVTVTNYPGETATVAAQIKFASAGKHINLKSNGERWRFKVDGTRGIMTAGGATPPACDPNNQGRCHNDAALFVSSSNNVFLGLDVQMGNRWLPPGEMHRTGLCVYVGGGSPLSSNLTFEKNKLHGCGVMENQSDETLKTGYATGGNAFDIDNRASGFPDNHAIYVGATADASNVAFRDNLIYRAGERGIQLYPAARDVLVEGNIISGVGQGVVFDNATNGATEGNVVRGNVVNRSNHGFNIYEQNLTANNVAQDNCVYSETGTSGIEPGMKGVTATGNVTADPRFYDGWRIGNAACKAKYAGTIGR